MPRERHQQSESSAISYIVALNIKRNYYIFIMTKDEIYFYIQSKKEFEFVFKGKTYVLNYDKDDSGKEYIVFGQLYEGKRFESYGDLMNHAKVENHFFRELLEDL